jgi:hypothetical protein
MHRFYPERRGAYSRAFLASLKADCPTCPVWPFSDNELRQAGG